MNLEKIKSILSSEDVMGIIFEDAKNYDEYDKEAEIIFSKISKNMNLREVDRIVNGVFCESFGFEQFYTLGISKKILELNETQ